MATKQYTAAYREALARADTSNVMLDTLEISTDFDITGLAPVYMVQAPDEYELGLETGGTAVFEPIAFRFTLPGQNDQGVRSINIAIDNVDKRIGDWLDAVSSYDVLATVVWRPYLTSDLTMPQMDPPLRLTLSDIRRTAYEVTGRATVADIVNLKFLRSLYLRSRFPSLGNT
jgi:hypothetical protein